MSTEERGSAWSDPTDSSGPWEGLWGEPWGLLSREGCDLTRFQGSSIHCEGSGDEEATAVGQAGGDGGWSGRGQGKWSEGSRTLEQS